MKASLVTQIQYFVITRREMRIVYQHQWNKITVSDLVEDDDAQQQQQQQQRSMGRNEFEASLQDSRDTKEEVQHGSNNNRSSTTTTKLADDGHLLKAG
mmetsp:Transcript_23357/g.24891  ORF Transcript_23357/g.24891 Transcript_23357/m.24891 type:complete len:98 (+) Transcript_23357:86-379(+)